MKKLILVLALLALIAGPAMAAPIYIDATVNSGTYQDDDNEYWNIVGNADGQGIVDSLNSSAGSVTVTG